MGGQLEFILFFLLLITESVPTRIAPPTSQLLEKLVQQSIYSRNDPPSLVEPTEIYIGIDVISFYTISETTMDYSLSLYFKQKWNDPRLRFTPNEQFWTNESDYKFDKAWQKIWVPDTFFRNEKWASWHWVTVENRMVKINPLGDVWYNLKMSATFSCPMNLHKYPLDTQICPMIIQSFGYQTDLIQLKWLDEPVVLEREKIPQYKFVDSKLVNCSQVYSYGTVPCLQIEFILKRDMGYFLIQVFFPTFLIVVLSWVSFWICVDAVPARVTLGLLTVLTMTNLSIGINSNLPKVSYIKAIDIWMSACLLFVFSALCEYAFVNVASRHKAIFKTARILPRKPKRIWCPLFQEPPKISNLMERESSSGVFLMSKAMLDPLPRASRPLDGKARAERIDMISRKCFPITFFIFNFIYWIGYIYII